MKIFITGGTGFIGSHLINLLHLKGYEVKALKRKSSISKIELAKEPEWLIKELDEVELVDLNGIDILLHLASAGVVESSHDWDYCFKINVTDSLKLFQTAIKSGVKKFMVCGTCSEYGLSGGNYEFIPIKAPLYPTGAYHASKAAFTMASLGLCIQNNLQFVVFRPFHIFGEGEDDNRFWPSLKKAALNGDDFSMTSGKQIRDFTPVEVCVSKIESLINKMPKEGNPLIINIGTGKPQSLLDFANYWWVKFNAKGNLLVGVVAQRPNEVIRYVPKIKT